MTTTWQCPNGHPTHTGFVVITDATACNGVWDGQRRYFPTDCTDTLCEYREGFTEAHPAMPVD